MAQGLSTPDAPGSEDYADTQIAKEQNRAAPTMPTEGVRIVRRVRGDDLEYDTSV